MRIRDAMILHEHEQTRFRRARFRNVRERRTREVKNAQREGSARIHRSLANLVDDVSNRAVSNAFYFVIICCYGEKSVVLENATRGGLAHSDLHNNDT